MKTPILLIRWAFIILIGAYLTLPSYCQNEIEKNTKLVWVTFGSGVTDGPNSLAFGYLGGINFQTKSHLFSGRFTSFEVMDGHGSYKEYSLIYGYAIPSKNVHVSLSAGPSYIVEGECELCTKALGLTIGAQAFYKISRAGIGTYLIASINKIDNYVGVTLAIHIGKLK